MYPQIFLTRHKFIACNENFASGLNKQRIEIIGYTDERIDILKGLASRNKNIYDKITEKKIGKFYTELVKLDGKNKWVSTLKLPHIEKEVVKEIISLSQDKTYLDFGDLYNFLFNNVSDSILVVEHDTKKIIFANNAASELLRYYNIELTQKTILQIHPDNEYNDKIETKLKKMEDGDVIEIRENDSHKGLCILDSKGNQIEVYLFLQKIIMTTKNVLVIDYCSKSIVFADDLICWLLGYKTAEDLIQKRIFDIQPNEDEDKIKDYLEKVVRDGKKNLKGVSFLHRDGSKVQFNITMEKLKNQCNIGYKIDHNDHGYYLFVYRKVNK